MKRIFGLVLAIAMLLTLAAPALADLPDTEILTKGSYTIDVNLQVPDDPFALVGGFKVTIPESIHLQYGVVKNPQDYSISFNPGRFPVGRKVSIDVGSDYFSERYGDGTIDYCCRLVPDEGVDGNDFWYWIYNDRGEKLIPYPSNSEGSPYRGYGFVDDIVNRGDEDTSRYGTINLVVDYSNDKQAPGNYHSTLTFYVDSCWDYDKEALENELNYRYIAAPGYDVRVADSWDDETAAIRPDGWPWEERIIGTEPIA